MASARWRASVVMIGVSGPICSASRTSSGLYGWCPSKPLTAMTNGRPLLLEVVDRREAVGEAAGVDEDDGADGAADQVVPHEPEPVLAGRAEQVQDQVLVEGDAAEVHGHRGGRLVSGVR